MDNYPNPESLYILALVIMHEDAISHINSRNSAQSPITCPKSGDNSLFLPLNPLTKQPLATLSYQGATKSPAF